MVSFSFLFVFALFPGFLGLSPSFLRVQVQFVLLAPGVVYLRSSYGPFGSFCVGFSSFFLLQAWVCLRVFPFFGSFVSFLRRVQFGILLQVLSTFRFLDRFRFSLWAQSSSFRSCSFSATAASFLWSSPGVSFLLLSCPGSLCSFCAFHFFLWHTFFHTEAGGSVADFRDYFGFCFH